jgi:hypothetical protein
MPASPHHLDTTFKKRVISIPTVREEPTSSGCLLISEQVLGVVQNNYGKGCSLLSMGKEEGKLLTIEILF